MHKLTVILALGALALPTPSAARATREVVLAKPAIVRPAPDVRDPELFRQSLLAIASAIEEASGIEPRVSQTLVEARPEDLRQWMRQFPDVSRLIGAAARIAERRAATSGVAPRNVAASTPFSPDYPPASGAYQRAILDVLQAPPLSIPVSNVDRCDTETWDDFFEVWYLTAYTIGQLEGACIVGSCDPTGVACLATCVPLELAKIFLDLAVVPVQLCDVHESSVNAAEIEAGYENSVLLLNDLAAHDANIDGDLAAHDTRLMVHDAEVQARLARIEDALGDVEQKRVHLQVVEVKNRDLYLVAATEGGRPVGVTFDSIEVLDERGRVFIAIPASAHEVEPGSYLVSLNLTPQSPDKIFRVRVRNGEVAGETVFHRIAAVQN